MKFLRTFIKGKMNKSVDERLVPDGEYVDALNIRVGNTETTEIGAVENTKGNVQLTTLTYQGSALSNDAKCIGAYDDGANDTVYWFVHDPNNSVSATNKVDIIVSFNVYTNTLVYHATAEEVLNFNPSYLINGVNLIDDFLFFTDNYNPPRRINVTQTTKYLNLTNADLVNVLVKPPLLSPEVTLFNTARELNYLQDKFVSFAYRFKYEDNEFSALSPFSEIAFSPSDFSINTDNFTNDGMINQFNSATVTVETGDEEVKEIEICFNFGDDAFVRVAERLNKKDLGIPDNSTHTITFDNSKAYNVLPEVEILRLYDNVPRKALAQTIMGNRVMYGNYLEGYNLRSDSETGPPVNIEYSVDVVGEAINVTEIAGLSSPGSQQNDIIGNSDSFTQQTISFDLSGLSLTAGSRLDIDITIQHYAFEKIVIPSAPTPAPAASAATPSFIISLSFLLPQDYASVHDLAQSEEFLSAIGQSITGVNPNIPKVKQPVDCATGTTLTDIYNCQINVNPTADFSISRSGWTSISGGDAIQVTSNPSSNIINFRVPSANFDDLAGTYPLPTLAEYFRAVEGELIFDSSGNQESLHSDRNYELAIEYLDEYGRASTALVSEDNAVYVPCSFMNFKNRLTATIPVSQKAPYWADKYRFLLKDDKFQYQTIYVTNWYQDPGGQGYWIQLEGENQRKVDEGDFLIVKTDVNGSIGRCCEVEVLDKGVKQENFLSGDTRTGPNLDDPIELKEVQGVYIRVKPDCFTLVNDDLVIYESDYVQETNKNSEFEIDLPSKREGLFCDYPVFDYDGSTSTVWDISQGALVEIYVELRREPANNCNDTCGARQTILNINQVSSQAYANLKEFFEGEGIIPKWQNSPDNTIPCLDDSGSGTAVYYNTLATGFIDGGPTANINEQFTIDNSAASYNGQSNVAQLQFYEVIDSGNTYLVMRVVGGYPHCANKRKKNHIDVYVKITNNPNLASFETQPATTATDLFYEGSDTYSIDADGNHLGISSNSDTDQDIASGTPATINLQFFNCYTFGNGVESYRILDSIQEQFFLLGQRTNTVLEGDYQEKRRFADVTYSGTFSEEQGVNRLNEFNLGLANFKILEQSFGDIGVLDSRDTDMLVLQEDKISYVLVGKNLLSDSSGGGSIASIPEVLGTQIARVEEFGISFNPESYVQWGSSKFFTDSKRGSVIQLKGAGKSEQLNIISDMGMDSWFRDLFREDFFTQKIGAYDPYMDEYVLSSNDTDLPTTEPCMNCGSRKITTIPATQSINFCVDYGLDVGTADIDYNILTGTADIDVSYNGVTSSFPGLTGSGTVQFAKSIPNIETASVTVTAGNDPVDFQTNFDCPVSSILNVVQVCVNTDADANETIKNQYGYNIGTNYFATQSSNVVLQSGGTSTIVSQYSTITGAQGQASVPTDGSNVTLYCQRDSTNTFDFDASTNGFKYLRSSTNYPNTPTGIANLLAAATALTTDTSLQPNTFKANFTLPNGSTNDYLYLIYDYRKSEEVSLCYESVASAGSPTDEELNAVCCDCTIVEGIWELDAHGPADFGAICPTSPPFNINLYVQNSTTGIVNAGDIVWADAGGTTKVLPGWYKLDDVGPAGRAAYINTNTSGFSEITILQNC